MHQPFRHQTYYKSTVWPAFAMTLEKDHLRFQSPELLTSVSGGIWGGGWKKADTFVNWKVPLSYHSTQPGEMMRHQLLEWGYDPDRSVGLQTAAKLTHAAIAEEAGDAFRILCCTTAGTSNSSRAGSVPITFSAYHPGTINTLVFIDGNIHPAAFVQAVVTATEAKAAVLQDVGLFTGTGQMATGTTTDAFVIASTQRSGAPVHAYAGPATTLGDTIARLVYLTVFQAVSTQKEE